MTEAYQEGVRAAATDIVGNLALRGIQIDEQLDLVAADDTSDQAEYLRGFGDTFVRFFEAIEPLCDTLLVELGHPLD